MHGSIGPNNKRKTPTKHINNINQQNKPTNQHNKINQQSQPAKSTSEINQPKKTPWNNSPQKRLIHKHTWLGPPMDHMSWSLPGKCWCFSNVCYLKMLQRRCFGTPRGWKKYSKEPPIWKTRRNFCSQAWGLGLKKPRRIFFFGPGLGLVGLATPVIWQDEARMIGKLCSAWGRMILAWEIICVDPSQYTTASSWFLPECQDDKSKNKMNSPPPPGRMKPGWLASDPQDQAGWSQDGK